MNKFDDFKKLSKEKTVQPIEEIPDSLIAQAETAFGM